MIWHCTIARLQGGERRCALSSGKAANGDRIGQTKSSSEPKPCPSCLPTATSELCGECLSNALPLFAQWIRIVIGQELHGEFDGALALRNVEPADVSFAFRQSHNAFEPRIYGSAVHASLLPDPIDDLVCTTPRGLDVARSWDAERRAVRMSPMGCLAPREALAAPKRSAIGSAMTPRHDRARGGSAFRTVESRFGLMVCVHEDSNPLRSDGNDAPRAFQAASALTSDGR
jgi:hypothetical protein